MGRKITVLIVDDVAETVENVRRLFALDDGFEVVGQAERGEEAVRLARKLRPDCVVMDVNMPGMDGITATERISLEVPDSVVVIMSVQGEQEHLRRAMLAGARDYLVKPFTPEELLGTIRRACEREALRRQGLGSPHPPGGRASPARIITVFSAKGGVGKSTIATNLAAILAADYGRRVALVDLDLQFGDVPVMLDLMPRRTIVDLAQQPAEIDRELVQSCLLTHSCGVQVLAAPPRPEEAEMVSGKAVEQTLDVLKEMVDYIVVDTNESFHETILAALDRSTAILLVATLDLPTVKNVKLCLGVMDSLRYPRERIKLVLNRSSEEIGIRPEVVQRNLDFPITAHIPSDGRLAIKAVNRGQPFILTDAQTPISVAVRRLAEAITGEQAAKNGTENRSLLGFLRR